jgi:hypothetical protein
MITVLIAALAYAGVRALLFAALSWREIPRSNEDMVFF